MEYIIEDIESCEVVGEFTDNEYVYDVEMADDSHTFVCNDVLVHNSAYITLQPIIDMCGIPIEQQTDFCLAIYNCILEGYLNQKFEDYAKAYNCKENLEKFELEKMSRTIIMLAKKNYMCDVSWVESGAHLEPLSHITYTGYDVVKGTISDFCRNQMKDFVEFILSKVNTGGMPDYDSILRKIKEIKMKFMLQSPNEIAKSSNLSDYEAYIKNDKNENGHIDYYGYNGKNENGDEVKKVVPIHARAAAVYNNLLYTKAKKYKSKYSFIHRGDKIKYYYTSPEDVFAFIPNQFPIEFAPKVDMETQFDKMILSPLNRIVSALGFQEVSSSLTYAPGLW